MPAHRSLPNAQGLRPAPAHKESAFLKVVFVGEQPAKSAPTLTLCSALHRRFGWTSEFSRGAENSDGMAWLSLVRRADAIVMISYSGPSAYVLRQLALAAAIGVPVIRWWVGSDVLRAIEDPGAASCARALSRVASAQVAVAPHLVDELRCIGIDARFIASPPSGWPSARTGEPPAPSRRALLVYLPTARLDFYGAAAVRFAAEAHPGVEFVIVADESHSLGELPNVRSLGWVEDLEPVWEQVGGLLRITRHDGMPRMVLDALLREKHVIYSWPLAGCVLARSPSEIDGAIARFADRADSNRAGPSAAAEILAPDPAESFGALLLDAMRGTRMRMRAKGAEVTLTQTASLGWSWARRRWFARPAEASK